MRTWLCIILVFTIDVGANADGLWTSYTDMSKIMCIDSYGDYLWCGAEGGVLRLNRHDGSRDVFTSADGIVGDKVRGIAVVCSCFEVFPGRDFRIR